MLSFIGAIVSLFSGLFSFFGKVADYVKERQLRNEGRKELQGEIAKKEAEVSRKQSEIFLRDDDREKTAKDLEEGKF